MQLAIWTRRVATQLLLSALLVVAWPHAAYSALPSAREIESQLEKAKQAEQLIPDSCIQNPVVSDAIWLK